MSDQPVSAETREPRKVEPCPECGADTVDCLEFCDCGWCADGVLRPLYSDGSD